MNLIPCENALVRLQSASKAQLNVVQHYFARRDLEAQLATLLDAARGRHFSLNDRPPKSAHAASQNERAQLPLDPLPGFAGKVVGKD